MADEIYIPSPAKVVFINPDDTDQVRQLSGSGSPQWVALSSATFSECSLTLVQEGSTGIYYGDLPSGLSAARRYQLLVYASTDTAFSDGPLTGEYAPENEPVNTVQLSGSGPAADNLETAALAYSTARGLAGTALPNAASGAPGGLPVSDAGGLDMDAIFHFLDNDLPVYIGQRTLPSAEYATAVGLAAGLDITITPVQVNAANPRYSTRKLAPVAQGSAPTDILLITDGAGAAINLSGKTLRMVVATESDGVLTTAYKYETGGSGLTVGGGSNNQVTIQHDDANTTTPDEYSYWLWNVTDDIVLCKGTFEVEAASENHS